MTDEIVVSQIGQPEFQCLMDEAVAAGAVPEFVEHAIRFCFEHEHINLVTITWDEGVTASFHMRQPDDVLVSVRKAFGSRPANLHKLVRDQLDAAIEDSGND